MRRQERVEWRERLHILVTTFGTDELVLPRVVQFDYIQTSAGIGLPSEMDFVNPCCFYSEFEDLPVPATIWPSPTPIADW